ncbi:DUF262 domain-containing protein [Megamonas hypermegale]|uniref:DUF262 domain-containing protein n=1 Tax=Megamonas hypermegale TaxID=158847 RepID=UPI0026F074C9|nr:DUF262 domain-containing protein [Megamonas hypermegale]
MENKIVDSKICSLKGLFADKFEVDFYQREYVWQRKQIEDLITDLSLEFLKNWKPDDRLRDVRDYDPYYMGEIVLSKKSGKRNSIIDGQQRITSLTLLLIYLLRTYGEIKNFPEGIEKLIYDDYYGEQLFNLDVEERNECMLSLYEHGEYKVKKTDTISVKNLVDRYNDINECWNEQIDEKNIASFTYWLKEKVVFSEVWTNSDEFAYVIFETMNDRGLSLTQVEMVRSYLLANIEERYRLKAMKSFDEIIRKLMNIKLTSKSKAEFEFFKIYFRSHYVDDITQGRNSNSGFVQIGKEFHRWLRDNSIKIGLKTSNDFIQFLNKITYFAGIYEKIDKIVQSRDTRNYLYLVVNSDYGFTLQPALILASISYNDSDDIVDEKIKIVSRYLTKLLSWRVWNQNMISQSAMESTIYSLCKKIRNANIEDLKEILKSSSNNLLELENSPTLNRMNKNAIKVLLSLITELVARNINESDYMLNKEEEIEIEHIWSNHYEEHVDEFDNSDDFVLARNNIGDLLVLPRSFNRSYGDKPYSEKVKQYFSQNILAQTLNEQKYKNNPSFLKFIKEADLNFCPYDKFTRKSINERAELYKEILKWNWK